MREGRIEPAGRPGGDSDAALRRALRFLLCGWALTLPVSIAATQFFAYPAALLTLWLWARAGSQGSARSPLLAPALVFAAAAVAAAFLGPRTAHSLWKTRRLILFLPLLFSVRIARGSEPGGGLETRLGAWFLAGASVHALYDAVRIPLLAARGEWLYGLGTMRDPQLYMVGLLFVFCAWDPGAPRRRRAAWALAALVCAAGLLLHFKRGAWFSLALAFPVLAALARRWKPLVLFAVLAALALALPASRARLGDLRPEISARSGGRMTLWTRVAPGLIARHPFGMGIGGATNRDFRQFHRRLEPKLNHLHNNALQVLLETGWIGLLSWCAWMLAALRMMLRALRRHPGLATPAGRAAAGAFGGFLALMINGMVEYNFGDGEIFMLLLLLIGGAECLRAAGDPARGTA